MTHHRTPRLFLLTLLALGPLPAIAMEPEELHGLWAIQVDESVERALTQPRGAAMDRDQMRRIIASRAERVKLRITDSTIGLVFGQREQTCQIEEVEARTYKVTYQVNLGGKPGRIEMTAKGDDHFVYTSTLTDDWSWSVWERLEATP